ncbi:MAG: TolC family protein, partial [Acidobacteriota bacterium]
AGRAAMARVGISRSSYYPAVSLSGSLSRSYAEQSGSAAFSGSGSGYTSSSASVQGQYTLWDSGERKALLNSARSSYTSSDQTYKANVQDLALSVETAYYGLVGAQWDLAVARDTKRQTQFHLAMAKAQQKVGLVPRSDVLQAETANANAILAVIRAEGNVTSSRAALAVLMGFPSDHSFEIQEVPLAAPLPGVPDWNTGRRRALETLPEIQAALANAESFKFSLDAAEKSYRPVVTADGSYGRQDAGNWPDLETWSIGLTLRVPLFTGFSKTYQVVQARESWKSAQMSVEATKLGSEKAAYDARTQLVTARQAVEASEKLVASARENADVAEGRYKQGLGSMLDVVDATTSLQNARLNQISARLSLLTALADWDRATGKSLLGGIDVPSTDFTSPDRENMGTGKPARMNGEVKR